MENFPPNSKAAQEKAQEPRVERVTSAAAKRRKKSFGKQFKETFVIGDAKTAARYMFFNVLVPGAQDAFIEAIQSGIERLIRGDSRPRPRRGMMGMMSGPNPYGHVDYARASQGYPQPEPPRQLSRRARSQHEFDEIVLANRQEAEDVIERLFDVISRYDSATVADLYELTGLVSTHTDHKWGWTDLRGANAQRMRNGGYLLNLPQPEPLPR